MRGLCPNHQNSIIIEYQDGDGVDWLACETNGCDWQQRGLYKLLEGGDGNRYSVLVVGETPKNFRVRTAVGVELIPKSWFVDLVE